MGVRIRRWQNGTTRRLPTRETGVERTSPEPITLEWLLEGITPGNVHPETDWGPPVGREYGGPDNPYREPAVLLNPE